MQASNGYGSEVYNGGGVSPSASGVPGNNGNIPATMAVPAYTSPLPLSSLQQQQPSSLSAPQPLKPQQQQQQQQPYVHYAGGGGDATYGIRVTPSLEEKKGAVTHDYPEAVPHYVDVANALPVEGEPIYPEESARNPHLARFVKRGWKDVWAAVLFAAVVLMTLIWGIVSLAMYSSEEDTTQPTPSPSSRLFDKTVTVGYLAIVLVCSIAASMAFACGSLMLCCAFPFQMIYVANMMSIVVMAIGAIMAFVSGSIAGGVIILVLCALQGLWFYFARARIPFSAELMRASSRLVSRYKAIVLVNLLLVIGFFVYMVLWSGVVLPYMVRVDTPRYKPVYGFIIALFVLVFFWVAQVVPNVMDVTAAGVMATLYFAGSDRMPPNPTVASFKRAMTTSFGSICFGSLIVAGVQFLRWLVEASRNEQDGANFLRCVLDCLLSIIESLVEYFNTYAFVHVAIYGCGYIEAARRTFALCQQCFYAALFNDALVAPTLNLLSFASSVMVGTAVGLATGSWVLGLMAFLICAIVFAILFTAVKSAATTIFVCFAEVPEALMHSDPDLYRAIHAADEGMTGNHAPPPPPTV